MGLRVEVCGLHTAGGQVAVAGANPSGLAASVGCVGVSYENLLKCISQAGEASVWRGPGTPIG